MRLLARKREVSMLDLEAIKARCDAATAGPWFSVGCANGFRVECGEKGEDGQRNQWIANIDSAIKYECADAEFIAHARECLPALVAEVERLRHAVDTALEWAADTQAERLKNEIEQCLSGEWPGKVPVRGEP
jgi:hypothetical protein